MRTLAYAAARNRYDWSRGGLGGPAVRTGWPDRLWTQASHTHHGDDGGAVIRWPWRSRNSQTVDLDATQLRDAVSGRRRRTGLFSVGTVVTVVGGLAATLLGGGLAIRHSNILDGNTWITASANGVERLLRINPGAGEVDVE